MKKRKLTALTALVLAVLMLSGCARIPDFIDGLPLPGFFREVLEGLPFWGGDDIVLTPPPAVTSAPTAEIKADPTPTPNASDYPAIEDPGKPLEPFTLQDAVRADLSYEDMVFTAPDADRTNRSIRALLAQFEEAQSAAQQVEIIREIDRITSEDANMVTLANLQFSIDTTNPEYKEHQEICQAYNAAISDAVNEFYLAILNSRYFDELEAYFGETVIDFLRRSTQSYDPAISALQPEIDALVDSYSTYCTEHSGDEIPLGGNKSNTFSESEMLGQLRFYGDDPDMAYINKLVEQSLEGFYSETYTEKNDIFTKLVNLRNEQARIAGYDSYPEYAIAVGSDSYTYEDIRNLISTVRAEFVPIMKSLRESGAEHLGEKLTSANYYLAICPAIYATDDPDLTEEEQLEAAIGMLNRTSGRAKEMTSYMQEHGLFQVFSSPTKEEGAYTTYFNGYKEPFIFAHDPDTFTLVHEMGHALNYFLTPEPDMGERFSIGTEIAEVHSMAMEMLCVKFYPEYYGDSAKAAEAYQVFNALYTILDQTLFSEFEITLYENPDLGPEGRAELYSRLQEEYGLASPGNRYLNDGRSWTSIHHFYSAPIYVQDYTLAQSVALEIWEIGRDDWDAALKAYDDFLYDQEELVFSRRLEHAGLSDPLKAGTLQDLAARLGAYFSSEDYTGHYAAGKKAYDEMMSD